MNNPSTNKIAVIVLNWNGSRDTVDCIESLKRQTYRNFQIVVVDNGSTESEREILDTYLAHSDSSVIYLKNDRNLGFAGGVNTGITYAMTSDYDAVALVNNDATVDTEWLAVLEQELHRERVGIVTGALLHTDNKTIDSTGEFYTIWGLPFPRSRDRVLDALPQDGFIFGATGGSTLYRMDVFKQNGLFDDTFFAYYEDVDVSFRAQLSGWKVFFAQRAITYHKQGASSRKIPGFGVYQTFKNLPVLYRKNVPRGLRHVIGPRFYIAYSLMLLNAIKNGNGVHAVKGFIQSIALIPHAYTERKTVQANKTVSNSYIRSILWPDLPPDQTGLRKLRRIFTGKD